MAEVETAKAPLPEFTPKVEENVEVPIGSRPNIFVETLRSMKVGQSFEFPEVQVSRIRAARFVLRDHAKEHKYTFVARVINPGTRRIWKQAT